MLLGPVVARPVVLEAAPLLSVAGRHSNKQIQLACSPASLMNWLSAAARQARLPMLAPEAPTAADG
jgi:hypothetical protein